MKVDILNPSGFCGGVINVLKLIDYVVEKHKFQPIYCVGDVVHNSDVTDSIKKKNIKICKGNKDEIIDNIQEGVVIFSAHGTDEQVVKKAIRKGLIVYNAICPFVDKSFDAIKQKDKESYDIIYIGKKGHDEANAAMSFSKNIHLIENEDDVDELKITNDKIAIINQTTLSILDIKNIYDKIKKIYPNSIVIDEICNTTRIRQQNLIEKAPIYDGVIVVGDNNSSNSKSLYNISLKLNKETIMILNDSELKESYLNNKNSILIVSGASTPNYVIDKIYKKIKIK